MTAFTAPSTFAHTTLVDRVLLRASARLDAVVSARLARRAESVRQTPLLVHQTHVAEARQTATALAAMGILPR
jgi:hypothetical protein